jgi:hypothetical protein
MLRIDTTNIDKLKNIIYYDDQPYYLPAVLKGVEALYNWNDILRAVTEGEALRAFDGRAFNEGSIEFVDIKSEDEKLAALRKAYEDQLTIVCSNWHKYNESTAKIVNHFKNTFSSPFGPAFATSHMYTGTSFSRSFDPHVDIPSNIIFQVEGKSLFKIYRNRCSALMDVNTIADSMRQHHIYNAEMDVLIEGELSPGDMLYIPARQYHYIEPITERVSVSIPLVSSEEWYEKTRDTSESVTSLR